MHKRVNENSGQSVNLPSTGGEAGFPTVRMRRLRYKPRVRELVRQTTLSPANLILPLFVSAQVQAGQEIPSMRGQFQLSLDALAAEVREAAGLALGGVILF